VVVSSILSSSCCRWRGATPWGWHPSTIIRLQGFSSCSPAAVPCRWSSRRMTTSLVVGRSKSGCGLPPALSFKDVHHPCWGGGCAELGPASTWVAARFFPQCSGEKGVRRLWCCQLPRVWLPGLGGSGVQVAAVVGAEVVAAAGEAPHYRGGCLRRRDRQCHLLPDLRLFGFNGLLSPPVGRRGQGPTCSGAHAGMIAAAGKSSVQRRSSSSVLMRLPLLVSRLGLVIRRPLLVWR
jgi:hypothetical protein